MGTSAGRACTTPHSRVDRGAFDDRRFERRNYRSSERDTLSNDGGEHDADRG